MGRKSPGGDDDVPEFDWDNAASAFDEDFVKGGVHEPPARTRSAIAKFGEQEESRRFGAAPAKGARPGRKPRRAHAPRNRGSKTALVVSVAVGALLVAAVLYTHFTHHGGSNLAGIPDAPVAGTIAPEANTTAASGSSLPEVEGMTPADPVGTCYTGPDPQQDEPTSLHSLSCTQPHLYELVSHEKASGNDDTYPNKDYWGNDVRPVCYRALVGYTGETAGRWPTALEVYDLIPTRIGWQTGDRSVYCLGRTFPLASTSVRALSPPTS